MTDTKRSVLFYRFFLSWRHASFAGNLVVVWAVFSLCITAYKEARELLWIIPLAATPIGILFWMIDEKRIGVYTMRPLMQGST